MANHGSRSKEQILDAALRLMQIRGYHRTGLGDVLRASGTGKGLFYHYFRSKEELGYAILDRVVQGFTAETLDPVFGDQSRSPLAQVDAFLDAIVQTHRARKCVGGCPIGNLAMELADAHEGFRRRLTEIFEGWRCRVAAALVRARADGALSADADPDRLARFLVAGVEGAILLTKVEKDIGVMEACVAELRRHLTSYREDGGPGARPASPGAS
jgi:TetR/AcrR family transcriptional repressor of nem operon